MHHTYDADADPAQVRGTARKREQQPHNARSAASLSPGRDRQTIRHERQRDYDMTEKPAPAPSQQLAQVGLKRIKDMVPEDVERWLSHPASQREVQEEYEPLPESSAIVRKEDGGVLVRYQLQKKGYKPTCDLCIVVEYVVPKLACTWMNH
ncbi:hypothetical protein BJ508DRAFT_360895 [Ascobolus immersus RN42]|uniref:Uncharacterized protein n=1 Tax=Ascobolus immersus RN42 TaxID=1160509 RepID=A0A3N4IA83_ASCIM|nr:hypothetical protein BJ508DRAFT_360895 [Ascobolus immersus RN42]